jgi:hypothetical protein
MHDGRYVSPFVDKQKRRISRRGTWVRTLGLLGLLILMCFSTGRAQDRHFPLNAVVNVTLPPYHVRPGNDVDNTAEIQRAITENVGTGRVLYFPAGTYFISDTLVAKGSDGLWKARLTLQGESHESVILRLADHFNDFNDITYPKSMLMTGSIE